MVDIDRRQYAVIKRLRYREKVLTELKPAGLPADSMIIGVTCGDGHRIFDILNNKRQVHGCHFHLIAMNGGAMLLSDACPVNRQLPWDRLIMQAIVDAAAIKKTNLVALGSHFPCGLATQLKLSVEDIVRLTLDGRRRLKDLQPHLHIYAFLHVVHGDGRHRTYTIDHQHPRFHDPLPSSLTV